MVTIRRLALVLALCGSILILPRHPALAQSPTQTSTPNPTALTDDDTIITLERFGLTDQTMYGPSDSRAIRFKTPAEWQLQDNASVQLDLSVFVSTSGQATQPLTRAFAGSLSVRFNNVELQTILLDRVGDFSITIPISETALAVIRPNESHTLSVSLSAGVNCTFDQQTSVIIRSSSRLNLPHRIGKPVIDLTLLPYPIYQDALLPQTAIIVTPDQPSNEELRAAMIVAAGFGRMSHDDLTLMLTTTSQLEPTIRDTSHLIFIGKAAGLPQLKKIDLPPADAQPDDGVLQMAVSPWNDSKAVLVVSGENDSAVVKAAVAVGEGIIRPTRDSTVALVADIRSITEQTSTIPVDQTFATLGYETYTKSGVGNGATEYTFALPGGQTATTDAYIDIFFNHSTLLNYERSGFVVRLNGEPLGGARLSDETAQQGTLRLGLPASTLHAGINQLSITISLNAISRCLDTQQAGIWLNILSSSLLHMPLQAVTQATPRIIDLSTYYDLFARNPLLDNVALVVAPGDVMSWSVASQLASDLANRVNGSLANITVVYADAVSPELRSTRDLIIIGKPANLSIIAELGSVLPAPFDPGSNQANLSNSRVVYRVAPDANVGYVELAVDPANPQHVLLAVLGSTNQGLQLAGNSLTDSGLRSTLNGNVAIIDNERITVADTRFAYSIDGQAPVTTVPVSPDAPATTQPTVGRSGWILPAIILTAALMIGIILYLVLISWRRTTK